MSLLMIVDSCSSALHKDLISDMGCSGRHRVVYLKRGRSAMSMHCDHCDQHWLVGDFVQWPGGCFFLLFSFSFVLYDYGDHGTVFDLIYSFSYSPFLDSI